MEVCESQKRKHTQSLIATLVWFSAYFGARLLLKMDGYSQPERVAISLIPIPFFLWFVWVFVKRLHDTDELERKIQLESLAIAFPMAILMLMTLGLLQKAIALPQDEWGYTMVWWYLPMFYTLGYAIASYRYR